MFLFWTEKCKNWNSVKWRWRFPLTNITETTKRHLNAFSLKLWYRMFSSIVYALNLDKIIQIVLLQVGVKFILYIVVNIMQNFNISSCRPIGSSFYRQALVTACRLWIRPSKITGVVPVTLLEKIGLVGREFFVFFCFFFFWNYM